MLLRLRVLAGGEAGEGVGGCCAFGLSPSPWVCVLCRLLVLAASRSLDLAVVLPAVSSVGVAGCLGGSGSAGSLRRSFRAGFWGIVPP